MRRFFIPLLAFTLLAAIYLANSSAPFHVHALSIAVLFLAIPISVWICTLFHTRKGRIISALVSANLVGLCWDSTAHFVIIKVEFIFMIRFAPWLYIFVSLLLGTMIYVLAWLARRPNPSFNSDPTATI